MRRKLLLCVSAFHLTAAVWSRGQLRACQEFSDDEAGQREFMAFLGGLRRIPIYFLADTLDEDYRFELLPRATGRDQRELLQRKLKQSYRNSPFCTAQLLQRDKDNKREDRYFFAALTNSEGLNPWLPLVLARRVPIVGIYLAPLTFASLTQVLGLGDRSTLVVSLHAAGLRQTFFKGSQFRVSRLTLARPESTSSPAVSYAEEVRNTRMYLDALNVTHVDERVTILLLDQDGSLATVAAELDDASRNLDIVRIPPEALAKRIGVPIDILQTNADALPLQLLGKTPPAINLAPLAVTSGYNRMQAARIIYGASVAIAAGAALWFGLSIYRASTLDDEAQEFSLKARGEEARYSEIARNFPSTPATSEQLRQAADAASRIRSAYRTPDAMLQVLGQALDQSPNIALRSFVWKHGRATAVPAQNPGAFAQSATIAAELLDFAGDYRAATALVEEFLKQLGSIANVAQVRATKLPVSTSPTSALSGDTATVKSEKPIATFEVEITLRPGV